MPKEKKEKLTVKKLRHNEYYDLQNVYDELYAKAKAGEVFTDLMSIVLHRDNILLAYRNIKSNSGSNTPGTDGLTMEDIGRLTPDEVVDRVRRIVTGSKLGYRPRPVRRKEIPKPNGKTRPLGIPCAWDKLVQQCILQVMELICEAKFSEHSYGFRPMRSTEHAIAETYQRINQGHLYYVVDFDIKGFFDNVNHQKLLRQIWSMGIHDEILKSKIKRILRAPIKMPNGKLIYPTKGTPQGGVLSPLLANICLNELDHWVESNWENNPVAYKYSVGKNANGTEIKSHGYAAMRKTKLKEMYIVRYADDFRIFCRTKTDAYKTKAAVTQWLRERLKLEVSEEKTRVVNVKRHYSEFLGIKLKVHEKGNKNVVKSHMSDKALKRQREKLVEQVKRIAQPEDKLGEAAEIRRFNEIVTGMHGYYSVATNISLDCNKLAWAVKKVLAARFKSEKGSYLTKKGRPLRTKDELRYGKSKQIRYSKNTKEPILPVGYVRYRNPMMKRRVVNPYTAEGRAAVHDTLCINMALMHKLMRQPLYGRSIEYADNRVSLFSAQWGKCAVTGQAFQEVEEIHCHHITPKTQGGTDDFKNLVLVDVYVHRLIHAKDVNVINKYQQLLKLDKKQLKKLNAYRLKAGNTEI